MPTKRRLVYTSPACHTDVDVIKFMGVVFRLGRISTPQKHGVCGRYEEMQSQDARLHDCARLTWSERAGLQTNSQGFQADISSRSTQGPRSMLPNGSPQP